MEKIQKAKDVKSKVPIKTWSRRSVVTPIREFRLE